MTALEIRKMKKMVMPYPFKKETPRERLLMEVVEDWEEWAVKLWKMMNETVSDAPSAFLEQTLTDLEIEHKVKVFDGTEDH